MFKMKIKAKKENPMMGQEEEDKDVRER